MSTSTTSPKWRGTDLLRTLMHSAGAHAGDISGFLGRLEQVAAHTAQAFRAQEDAPDDPAVLDTLAKGILHQLDRLHAECQQQIITLLSTKLHDPLMLDMAIYGLSGMREQLDFTVEKFDKALSRAQRNEMSAFDRGQFGQSGAQWANSGQHVRHPTTQVARPGAAEANKRGGPFGLFRRKPAPDPNEQLAQRLLAAYREYSRATLEVQQAFRIAQPQSLSELTMPIDELRALAERLHKDELTFYTV